MEGKVQATQHDNDLRLENSDAKGVGISFHGKDGSGKSRHFAQVTLVPTKLSQQSASKRYPSLADQSLSLDQ